MKAKEKHKINLLKYLADWANDFPTRTEMAGILGLKKHTLWKHFSPAEFQEIENEGLELRKKGSSKQRALVYTAMLKEAVNGNVSAQREFLDRTEGKVKDKLEINEIETLTDEELEESIDALLKARGGQSPDL